MRSISDVRAPGAHKGRPYRSNIVRLTRPIVGTGSNGRRGHVVV